MPNLSRRWIDKGDWVLLYPGDILARIEAVDNFDRTYSVLVTDFDVVSDIRYYRILDKVSDTTAIVLVSQASCYKHAPDEDELAEFYAGMIS